MTTAVQKKDKNDDLMVYAPFGTDTKIKLSINIVKNLIAGRTRKGHTCSDRDAMRFMMLCQAKALNPFEGDAYLLGYDTNDGPAFSQITAHQAFLKRAEVNENFDGMESGVILLDPETGAVTDREGDFLLPGERKNLVGGWARVHKKNTKIPTTRRLSLEVFNTNQSRWLKDPGGMITKCAEADALRSAFPTKLGGMYNAEELSHAINVDATVAPAIDTTRLVTDEQGNPTGEVAPEPEPKKEVKTSAPATEKAPEKTGGGKVTAKKELELLCESEKIPFNAFQRWGLETNNVPGADSMAGFQDVPEDLAKRLLRAKDGLVKQIHGILDGGE